MTNRLRRDDPVGRLLTDPEVATPAFVIDDAKLQVNLDFAKEKAARLGVTLRPHLKTHKSIEIARRQMLSPEGPATVSTLAEARYFAENGVKDLIYAVGIAPQARRRRRHPRSWGRSEDHPRQRRGREGR